MDEINKILASMGISSEEINKQLASVGLSSEEINKKTNINGALLRGN